MTNLAPEGGAITTAEVLHTARCLFAAGRSAETASFGDWPDAVRAFDRANRWNISLWLFPYSRTVCIKALDRAIAYAEAERKRAA